MFQIINRIITVDEYEIRARCKHNKYDGELIEFV